MMSEVIYLDNNSTTQVDPRVVESMLPYFSHIYGNASSSEHSYGWAAEEAVDNARGRCARVINCSPREITFTSGATESNNLSILGYAQQFPSGHIISSEIEHDSVLEPLAFLNKHGFQITYVRVDSNGQIDMHEMDNAFRHDTVLCTMMMGNNEIGTVFPINEIGVLCKSRGIVFHVDATQSIGKIPVDVNKLGIDMLSFSGHKLHGPKGVGGLFVRRKNPRVPLLPRIFGGGQEHALRPGTLNVPGIVGLGTAIDIAQQELDTAPNKLSDIRDSLMHEILRQLPDAKLIGDKLCRLPNNISLYVPGVQADALIAAANGIAISSASACVSHGAASSHVLNALRLPVDVRNSIIRMGVSRFTTEDEIMKASTVLANSAATVRRAIGYTH